MLLKQTTQNRIPTSKTADKALQKETNAEDVARKTMSDSEALSVQLGVKHATIVDSQFTSQVSVKKQEQVK